MTNYGLILTSAVLAVLMAGCPATKPVDTPPADHNLAAQNKQPAQIPAEPEAMNKDVPPPAVDIPAQRANTGNAATDFEYFLFDGTKHKLSESFGKPTVVNFWADWCPPCVAELPHFEEAWKAKGSQFNLIVIAVKDAEDPRGFVSKNGYTMPFAEDISGAQTYGVTGIPMTLFIDRNGNIIEKVVGGMEKAAFETNLAKIL